jgi:hypothetical protein
VKLFALMLALAVPIAAARAADPPARPPAATAPDVNAVPRASGVDVAIESAKLDHLVLHRVRPKPDPEDMVADQPLLVIRLKVTNKSQKDVTYNSFNGAPGGKADDKGSLILTNKRPSALVDFGDLVPVGIVTAPVTLKPGDSVSDLLAFALPPQDVKPSTLFLPARNHGGVGLWRLPVKMEEATEEK